MFLNLYQRLESFQDKNSLFTAFSLSVLLPAFDDKTLFRQIFVRLFGKESITNANVKRLRQELEGYTKSNLPPSLTALINQYLRPRLANHLKENQQELISLFLSPDDYLSRIKMLETADTPCDIIDIKILSSLAQIVIHHYSIAPAAIDSHLVFPRAVFTVEGDGNCFFHAVASQIQRKKIDTTATYQTLRARAVNYLMTHRQLLNASFPDKDAQEAYLEDMRRDGQSGIQSWAHGPIIDALALELQVEFNILDVRAEESSLLKIHQHAPRGVIGLRLGGLDPQKRHYDAFESDEELFIARVITKSTPDLYFQALVNPRSITPKALGEKLPLVDVYTSDKVPDASPHPVPDAHEYSTQADESMRLTLLQSLLQQKLQQVFTDFPQHLNSLSSTVLLQPIISKPSVMTLLKDTQTTQLTLRGADIQEEMQTLNNEMCAAELKDALNIGTASPWLWGPLLTVGGIAGAARKAYTDEYKKNIVKACNLIRDKKYKEAETILDKEFKRSEITKLTASVFLSAEHYMMGHVLYAICAEKEGEMGHALSEYKRVIELACKNKKSVIAFVVEMHLLHLLKNPSIKSLKHLNRDTELNTILLDLTSNFSLGITELYWKLQEQMMALSKAFITQKKLSEAELDLANNFINADVAFILEHFSNGRGKFFEISCMFFKGAILVFFGQENHAYLYKETKLKLLEEANCQDESIQGVIKKLASEKLHECAKLIQVFKKSHDHLTKEATIAPVIDFIQSFILNYFALSSLWEIKASNNEYQQIAVLLDLSSKSDLFIKNQEYRLHFLAQLCIDFNLPYKTLSEWLHDLSTKSHPILQKISLQTGDTMLHRIVHFQTEIPEEKESITQATLQLKEMIYVRNHQNRTPLYQLKINDPLDLKELLISDLSMLKYEKITQLVNKLQSNPVHKPFLLLAGPDLEGQKMRLRSHFKKLGFEIDELIKQHDLSKFFENYKNKKEKRVIFISELEDIVPDETKDGRLSNNIHILSKVVENFIGSQTIIVGVTKSIARCDASIIELADNQYIDYPLPKRDVRLAIINYLLREKVVTQKMIEYLADVTFGYASENLKSFIESIILERSSEHNIITYLSDRLEEAFLLHSQPYDNNLYFAMDLAQDIRSNLPYLAKVYSGLSMEQVESLIHWMMISVNGYKPTYTGPICFRLQDVVFFIQQMKMNKQHIPRDSSTIGTYIQKNEQLIFPRTRSRQHIRISAVFPNLQKNNVKRDEKSQVIFREILETLKNDFDLSFVTIDTWLDAMIKDSNYFLNLVSPKTGDTILHVLVKLPYLDTALELRVEEAACLLKQISYVRNNNDETPLGLLGSNDPYNFRIFLTEPMIKMGKELDRVETFLNKIKNAPDIESHFLLLDGPPGTGKTQSVLTHVRSLGYAVYEWVRGNKDDQYHNALITRAQDFFKAAEDAAQGNVLQVLFIDEIHGIIPKVEGQVENGRYDHEADVTVFLNLITALKGKSVVLIGATNFPNRLSKALLSRAADNRIYFPLPTQGQRLELLIHFFKEKQIKLAYLEMLAKVTVGYSLRQLQSFVDSFLEKTITYDMMVKNLNAYVNTLKNDFSGDCKGATLYMPSFEQSEWSKDPFSFNPELEELMIRLRQNDSANTRMHALLYGPPGGGKTTAVRNCAETVGRVLIAIQADHATTKDDLSNIFERAKQLENVIIFVDEMDRIAGKGAALTSFFQTEMDGITSNNITVIGATNYYLSFSPEMLDRFGNQILLPKLTVEQLNVPIKNCLLTSIVSSKNPVYFDKALDDEMQAGATRLAISADKLSLRQIKSVMSYLISDLNREGNGISTITYLRLQDVCYFMLIKKIQVLLVAKQEGVETCLKYIRDNKQSFFPEKAPLHSVPASTIKMNVTMQ